MSRRGKNNIIIGGLIAVVLIMAVGFAAFSSSLTINGTSSVESNWNIEITSIQADKTATKTGDVYTSPGTISESIGADKLSVQFSAALISPGDTITYTIVVENKGSLNAILSTLNNTNSENEYISFRINGIKQGDILNAGQSKTFTVTIKYKNIPDGQGQPDNTIGDFGISLDFIQSNGEGIPATSTAQEVLDYSFSKTTKSITLAVNNTLDNVDYYEYYIDGSWNEDSNNTHVFDNLSSGTHTVNVRAVKENGEEITSQEKQVTLDNLDVPSFTAVYNSADNVDVTINYPEGCGSTLTCTYNKNYTRGVETVTSTSETVNFIDDGYVIASVTDGTNTVSSTYTVTIGNIIPATSTSSDGLTPNGYTASSIGTGSTPNIVMGKLFYSAVDTTNSIILTVNESLLNLSNGYSYAYCIDEDCTNNNWSNDSSNIHEFTNLSPGTHTVNVKVITNHGKEYIGTSREVTLKTVKIPSFKAVYNRTDDVDVTVYYPEGCGNELECSYDIYRIYNYGTDYSYEQYETSNPVYSRTETIKFEYDGYIVARINDGSREVSSTYTLIMPNLATSTSTSTASATATGDLTPNGFIATSSGTGTGPNIAMGKLFYSTTSTTNSITLTVNESLLNLYSNPQYYYCIDEGCTNNEWQQEWSNTYEFTNLSPGTHTVNVKVITSSGEKEYIGASREVTVKDIEVPSFKAVYNYTDDVDVTVYYPEGCGNELQCSYDIYRIYNYGTDHSYEQYETSNPVYSRTETIKFEYDGYIVARISDGYKEVSSTYTLIMPNLATSTGSSSGSASGNEWIPASSGHVATSSGTGTGPYISLGKLLYSASKTTNSITLTVNTEALNMNHGYEFYYVIDEGTASSSSTSDNVYTFENLSGSTHTVNVIVRADSGRTYIGTPQTVTLDEIGIPSFKAVYNYTDDVDVTVYYPEGCGNELQCSYDIYKINYYGTNHSYEFHETSNSVYSSAETINLNYDGYIIARISDGSREVSSTYTVIMPNLATSTGSSSGSASGQEWIPASSGHVATSSGTGTGPYISLGKLLYSASKTTNSITLTVNTEALNMNYGYYIDYVIDGEIASSSTSDNVYTFENLSGSTHTVNVIVRADSGRTYIGTPQTVTLDEIGIPSFRAVYNYTDDVDVTVYYPEGCGDTLSCSYDIYRIYNYGTNSSYEQYDTSNSVYSDTETINLNYDGYIVARINSGSREVSSTYTIIMPNLATSTGSSSGSASGQEWIPASSGHVATSSGTGTGPYISLGKLLYSVSKTTNSITVTVNTEALNMNHGYYIDYVIDGNDGSSWNYDNVYTFEGLSGGTHTVNVRVHTDSGRTYIGTPQTVTLAGIDKPTFRITNNIDNTADVTINYPASCAGAATSSATASADGTCYYYRYMVYDENDSYIEDYTFYNWDSEYNNVKTISVSQNGYVVAEVSDGTNTVSSTILIDIGKLASATASSQVMHAIFTDENIENGVRTTITYPSECGTTYTCTYKKNNDEIVNVYDDTAYVEFEEEGYVITTISDGTDTVTDRHNVKEFIKIDASDTTTTSTITLTVYPVESNSQSEITKYEFSIDDGETWIDNGNNNVYRFEGLNHATSYNLKVRVTSSFGTTMTKEFYTVTSSISRPTFSVQYNDVNDVDVTITYPVDYNDNGFTYTYEKDSGSPVTATRTQKVKFTEDGELVATVTDGTNTVSATYTVTMPETITRNGVDLLVVNGGNGLYDNGNDSYIYKGSPNNYIQIGSDTYRIMEFTSDGQIKVVRDNSIATLPWDAGYSNNISGVTSTSSITGTRYSSNSSDFCYNSSASSYKGCKAWGSNTSTLNSSGNPVTSMPLTAGGTAKNLPDTDSYLNVYLNGGTYGGNGSTKEITGWYENNIASSVLDKIEDHMWPIGPVSDSSSATLSQNETQANAYKWQGKIGLMSIIDYVKASTNANCTNVYSYERNSCYGGGKSANYLANNVKWMISPVSSSGHYVWAQGWSDTEIKDSIVNTTYAVYPSFYLANCTTLTGSGTSSDKYRIVTDNTCVAKNIVSLKITNTKTTNSITTTATSNDQIKKYEFQLDNGNWIDNGTNNTLQFTGLSSGTHTVSVRVTTNDDKVSKKTTSVTLDTIAKPTFANQINGENDTDVTITYPSGCGSTLTCTYTKDNGAPVTVTSTTETVHFSAIGELVATVSDGTNTVSSTFTEKFTTYVYAYHIDTKKIGTSAVTDGVADYMQLSSYQNGKTWFLRYELDGSNVIQNAWACQKFTFINEPVCLQGGNASYYTANRGIIEGLANTFTSNAGFCGFASHDSYCYVGSLYLNATSYGYVYAYDVSASQHCYADYYGNAYCRE